MCMSMFCPRYLSWETKCFPEKSNTFLKQKWYHVSFHPTSRICVLIPEICLFFGSHIYIWQQISEVGMNELPWASVEGRACVHTQQKWNCWLGGFTGLPTTWRNHLKTYNCLGVAASLLSHLVSSWRSRCRFPLGSIQLPHEPPGSHFSSAWQTRNESAHSRGFMESGILRIERDFKDHEPAADICDFDPFI